MRFIGVFIKALNFILVKRNRKLQENEGDDREELLSKMEEFMKEGLDMCYRLNDNKKSISDLGNRKEIVEVLNKYPTRFEKEKYYPVEPFKLLL